MTMWPESEWTWKHNNEVYGECVVTRLPSVVAQKGRGVYDTAKAETKTRLTMTRKGGSTIQRFAADVRVPAKER